MCGRTTVAMEYIVLGTWSGRWGGEVDVFLNYLSRGTSKGNYDLRGRGRRNLSTCDTPRGVGDVESWVLVIGS